MTYGMGDWHLDGYSIFMENIYPSYLLNKKLKKYAYNKVNTIKFTKLLSSSTQTYHHSKTLSSNYFLRNTGCDKLLVIKMLLDSLFLITTNQNLAFSLIKKYNISFDLIDKFIVFYASEYKKLYTKSKKKNNKKIPMFFRISLIFYFCRSCLI